jgi:hypothetical protein
MPTPATSITANIMLITITMFYTHMHAYGVSLEPHQRASIGKNVTYCHGEGGTALVCRRAAAAATFASSTAAAAASAGVVSTASTAAYGLAHAVAT